MAVTWQLQGGRGRKNPRGACRIPPARTVIRLGGGVLRRCCPDSVTRRGRVVGYFSLTMGSVLRAEAPAKLVRGMPAYSVGMVLLARLAVDQSQQGRGVGAMLLAEALRKAVAAGEVAAARLIVVDAVDEDAAAFYQRYGFVRAPENPLRFYRRMKDVRASLDSSADG